MALLCCGFTVTERESKVENRPPADAAGLLSRGNPNKNRKSTRKCTEQTLTDPTKW
jgi:hypothetical protein